MRYLQSDGGVIGSCNLWILVVFVVCQVLSGAATVQAQDVTDRTLPAKRHFNFPSNQPMDAECRAFLDGLAAQKGRAWEEMTPTEARQIFASLKDLFGVGPTTVQTEDVKLGNDIACRFYRPEGKAPQGGWPVVMFFHGGGWVLGNLDTHDAMCRRISSQGECAVVAVDYRLAPEHAFPAALDDCFDATKSISEDAKKFGFDGSRIVVAGDSAGGNLAASVAIKARNKSAPKIVGQILIYPVIDHTCSTKSYSAFSEHYGLTKSNMTWFWSQYLADQEPFVYASPSLAQSLAGLPKTVIITAEYDVLRDEAEDFAERLYAAGVDTELQRIPGTIHGFMHFAGAFKIGEQTMLDISIKIKKLFSAIGQ